MIPKNHIQESLFPSLEAHPLFWAGPAPAQADSSIPEDLKKFGDTVKEKVLAAVDKVKEIDFSKAWSGPFPGCGRTERGREGVSMNRLGKNRQNPCGHTVGSQGAQTWGSGFLTLPASHTGEMVLGGGGEGSKLGGWTDLGP